MPYFSSQGGRGQITTASSGSRYVFVVVACPGEVCRNIVGDNVGLKVASQQDGSDPGQIENLSIWS